ncbi:MAG: AAA family ATPase [Deltaproteobacteria bacterium]|jgi:energy-coupling factor transporter ATP-binding protein EcfA2|nr:AAA family ATPase [Deltaproteobacteria bacterium]
MNIFQQPRWAQEIEKYLFVKSQFAIYGNIQDIYALKYEENTFLPLSDSIVKILSNHKYDIILEYTPLRGFKNLYISKENGLVSKNNPDALTLSATADILEQLSLPGQPLSAVLLNFSSRLPAICPRDIEEFYYRIYSLSQSSVPSLPQITDAETTVQNYARYHLILWILDKENDLPAWYTLDNHMVRSISIPKPDHLTRSYLVNLISPTIKGYSELEENERESKKSIFLDQTGGLFCREINDIAKLTKIEGNTFLDISDSIRKYKIGITDNPWSKLVASVAIQNAELTLSKKVIGQPTAVKHAADVIKRAVFNLSGSQFSSTSQRPKGVLFLAGPTGVGKTKLAKSLAQMIFGSETNCIRFDMSEFGQEHANQRLLGAPPGYVGYDGGGQLTNAVQQNPFSLILFDEIEKGHHKIWDIFLQILDDGRLTSGRGETVYFSESLLIFTSNLGVSDIDNNADYDQMQLVFKNSIEHFFKVTINRPEILNRIGNNIIVFDFIRHDSAKVIFDIMIKNTIEKVKEDHDITIQLDSRVYEQLQEICCQDLAMGGRGIGNNIELYFINPLARVLFEQKVTPRTSWLVNNINIQETICELFLTNINQC